MKKILMSLVIFAIAGIASAELVDGTFDTGTVFGKTSVSSIDESELDVGWTSRTFVGAPYEITGGVAQRTTWVDRGTYGIGQIITGNKGNDGSRIKFDINYSIAGPDGPLLQVVLIGFNDADGNFGTFNMRAFDDLLLFTGPDAGEAVPTVLYDSTKLSLSGTDSLVVDMAISGTGFDYYVFGMVSDDFNGTTATDTLTLDNVSIVSSGAPPTQGTVIMVK